MEADRWRRIEELYHSALALQPGERLPFLSNACKDDVVLRKEIESLLGADGKAADFIEAPAIQVAAQLLTPQEIEEHAPRSLESGTTISHYCILNKIGAGGMGEVYRAHDPRLNRDVAVKILPQISATDPERLRRFELEARSTAALNHPNIVAIYDVGTWEYGTPYVVTELLEGETLRDCLRRGPLPVRKAVEIASHVASGLSAAHDKGIIHRDLKPENLWLTKDGNVKILDFGLAKLLPDKPVAPDFTTLTSATSTKVMGTLGYMSPEQVRGKALDARTDIFSLGAVIYEMLSGRRAFQGPTPADTISAILNRDPGELSATNQVIPSAVGKIVHRCLEKEADQRFHTAKDVAYALAAVSPSSAAEISAPSRSPSSSSLPWKWFLLAAALMVLAAAAWIWNRNHDVHNGQPVPIRSLAVLPLENVSGTTDQDYFAEGMTDELITELARLDDVRVISRSSVMQFRGSKQPLPEIGRLLDVDAVLEGSVLRQGNKVRITAQLVSVGSDRHLWAHSYDGDIADVIQLQGEIAHAVTTEISAKLRPDIQPHPRPTVRPDVYDAYLKGLYFTAKLTPDDMQRGFDFFKKAIDADPTFAPAYAGMAEAYSWCAGLGILPPQEALAKAEAVSIKALDLDPNLGMAHHSMAWVQYARKWDFPGAEREFQRAIELSPNNATAHLWYGMFLAQRNRTGESFTQMHRARELDPLSSIVNGLSLTPLLLSHQYDKVIEQTSQGLKSDPANGLLLWLLTTAYIGKADLPHAIDTQEQQAVAFGEDRQKAEKEFADLRHEFALHGERAYWLAQEKSLNASPTSDAYDLATVEARLGKADAAYEALAKAYQQRSTNLLYWIGTEAAFDPFRSEPRFKELMHTMGLAGQT